MRYSGLLLCLGALAGCAEGELFDQLGMVPDPPEPAVVETVVEDPAPVVIAAPAPVPTRVAPPPRRPKTVLPPAQTPPPVAAGFGTTVASLGDVAEPGLWLKTPLVDTNQPGKITAANGTSVIVTLIPIDGPKTAGSRISIQALQALGLFITDLPELTVEPA